jgi:hypothetical protein
LERKKWVRRNDSGPEVDSGPPDAQEGAGDGLPEDEKSPAGDVPAGDAELPEKVEEDKEEGIPEEPVCPNCGVPIEPGAKFCTSCGGPLSRQARERVIEQRAAAAGVKPWAYKAGLRVSRMPWKVKLGIPVLVLLIIACVAAFFVIAAGHNPDAVVDRYFSKLQVGDLKEAYSLLSHPGGKFSSFDYFQRWQDNQTDNLGRMEDYQVRPRSTENRLLGRLIEEKPSDGTAFTATLNFKEESFDVNVTAKDAGGFWPFKRYRLRLSDQPTKLYVSPVGAEVYVDGTSVGEAVVNEDLEDALSLGDLPDDLDSAIDYARRAIKTIQYVVDEFRMLARGLDDVVEDVRSIFDRAGTGDVAWTEVMDAVNRTVSQSKQFGKDASRAAIHIYWIFGGGDDGSLRAALSRTETGQELVGLPEGFHKVEVKAEGMRAEEESIIAPESADISLKPDLSTEKELENTVQAYYGEVAASMMNHLTGNLDTLLTGDFLQTEEARIADLEAKGVTVAATLKSVKFLKEEMLRLDVAAVETEELWDYTTFQGPAPVNVQKNLKQKVVYTLVLRSGDWKIAERKIEQ